MTHRNKTGENRGVGKSSSHADKEKIYALMVSVSVVKTFDNSSKYILFLVEQKFVLSSPHRESPKTLEMPL